MTCWAPSCPRSPANVAQMGDERGYPAHSPWHYACFAESPSTEKSMRKNLLCAWVLCLFVFVASSPGGAQWYTPQSDRDLQLTWVVEALGPSMARIVGDVRNLSGLPATRVALRVEGLDHTGKVVSRARGYVPREIPARGAVPFEVRLSLSGKEEKYRVALDFFEFLEPAGGGRSQSP